MPAGIRPATDAGPAHWVLRPDVDWWAIVRYGPPGFEVYVRIAFADPDLPDDDVDDVRAALGVLAGCTGTPETAYAAIWEGWGGRGPEPSAPRLAIPNREMLLFTGPVVALRDTAGLMWDGTPDGAEPHLVWPADQAWCLACEVDEEIEFTVGCSAATAAALADALPGEVRAVAYGADAPMYRD